MSAQYETTIFLYDSISEGPYIEKEKSGYNFLWKNQEMGTMVSSRGQVMNPSVKYDVFNHYHIKADGQVDSIFSVTVREDISQHYQLYKKGLPKLIQYRVGTSNDPSIGKIVANYPIASSARNNDEELSINEISYDGMTYERLNKKYDKASYKEKKSKVILDLEAEEGTWVLKNKYAASNIEHPMTILAFGQMIEGDKTRKYNDLMDFRFVALNSEGEIAREEDIEFERAYTFNSQGIIHDANARVSGFYMSMVEAEGRANKDYKSSTQKILFFDEKGFYDSESTLTLPFAPKSKEVANNRILKILDIDGVKKISFYTPGSKKGKVAEGIYTFTSEGDNCELTKYTRLSEIFLQQDERNNFEGGPPASSDYKYTVRLDNGDLLAIASEHGTDLQFLHMNEDGEIEIRSSGYLLNDIASQKNHLSFEYLNNNKLLIISKVGYEKAVYSSYSIYDGKTGEMMSIQPTEEIATIQSFRNGNDIMVYGSSFEDDKILHLIHHKLDAKEEGLTSLEQDSKKK